MRLKECFMCLIQHFQVSGEECFFRVARVLYCEKLKLHILFLSEV